MDEVRPASSPIHLAPYSGAVARILAIQLADGAIPWFEDGPWDPWNHTESAMALTAAGHFDGAVRAFEFLRRTQRPDGAWLGEYGNALPMRDRDFIAREPAPSVLDTNFCAYPAVGVQHYLSATGDLAQVRHWWPMIRSAIDFVLSLQRQDGAISWAFEAVGTEEDDALLAGNASIAKSLECAISLADHLDEPSDDWRAARDRLVNALRNHPERFDRRQQGARFAMDWYYPVLSGALETEVAKQQLDAGWPSFVIAGVGCRCVSDEPWVTVAETCELVLALLSLGQRPAAEQLLADLDAQRDASGAYWMGWQIEEDIMWPKELPSWTQAAVILAADALYGTGAASKLLTTSAS